MLHRRPFLLSGLAALINLAACGARQPGLATAPGVVPVNPARFSDADPVAWPGLAPQSFPVHGIDISRYQSGIDWHRARDHGVSFAFLKATEGTDRTDPALAEHWNAAATAGIPTGAYHFYYFCKSAAEQAANFIRAVPRRSGALPPVLDIEWTPFSPTCRIRPGPGDIRGQIQIFVDALHGHYRTRPIVYTTAEFYADNGFADVTGTDFWLRTTARDPVDLYGRRDWRFWQYSGTGQVPGIPGRVDLNCFNGSAARWRQWIAAHRQP